MAIVVVCQNCGKRGRVPDGVAGKGVRCSGCASRIVVGMRDTDPTRRRGPSHPRHHAAKVGTPKSLTKMSQMRVPVLILMGALVSIVALVMVVQLYHPSEGQQERDRGNRNTGDLAKGGRDKGAVEDIVKSEPARPPETPSDLALSQPKSEFGTEIIPAAKTSQEPQPTRTDRERLQGTWKATVSRKDKKPYLSDLKDCSLTFTDDQIKIVLTLSGFNARRELEYSLDTEGSPKRIDFTSKSAAAKPQTFKGIYILDDKLKICVNNSAIGIQEKDQKSDPDAPRPKDFTLVDSGDDGLYLVIEAVRAAR